MIEYKPLRKAARAGAKLHTVKHEWRCTLCNQLVHTEPVDKLLNEEPIQTLARVERIKGATESHLCPKSDTED